MIMPLIDGVKTDASTLAMEFHLHAQDSLSWEESSGTELTTGLSTPGRDLTTTHALRDLPTSHLSPSLMDSKLETTKEETIMMLLVLMYGEIVGQCLRVTNLHSTPQ
jgi:hypothetical protein